MSSYGARKTKKTSSDVGKQKKRKFEKQEQVLKKKEKTELPENYWKDRKEQIEEYPRPEYYDKLIQETSQLVLNITWKARKSDSSNFPNFLLNDISSILNSISNTPWGYHEKEKLTDEQVEEGMEYPEQPTIWVSPAYGERPYNLTPKQVEFRKALLMKFKEAAELKLAEIAGFFTVNIVFTKGFYNNDWKVIGKE